MTRRVAQAKTSGAFYMGVYTETFVRTECLRMARVYEPDNILPAARAFAKFALAEQGDARDARLSALHAYDHHPMSFRERVRRAADALSFLNASSRRC